MKTTSQKADSILALCLDSIETSVKNILTTAKKDRRDLTPDELTQLLRTARMAADIRKGDRPKGPAADATYEQLLEEAKKFPELMDALRGSGDDEPLAAAGEDDDE